MKRSYSASLSRSQGRVGYSIIFRHPARRDERTGRRGIRVRRGLGTRDRVEAEQLRDELNQLLSDPKYRSPAARTEAETTVRSTRCRNLLPQDGSRGSRLPRSTGRGHSSPTERARRLQTCPLAWHHGRRQDDPCPTDDRYRSVEGALPLDLHCQVHDSRYRDHPRRRTVAGGCDVRFARQSSRVSE